MKVKLPVLLAQTIAYNSSNEHCSPVFRH